MLSTLDGIGYKQFGHEVLCTQVRFATLAAFFEIDHEVQRLLDPARRAEIRRFIIDSLEKNNPFYFSPFIFSARNQIQELESKFMLKPGSKLYVLDGQHRFSAILSAISTLQTQFESAEEFNNYQEATKLKLYIEQLKNYPIAMQIYLNLTKKQERQLFTDYNTERKDAHSGLMLRFDQRDQYSNLTREIGNQLQNEIDIEMVSARLSEKSSAATTLITMKKCLIALFEGILTVKLGDPYPRNCKPQDVPKIAKAFFDQWLTLFPKIMYNRNKYVAGLSGIQIALAYTVFIIMRENKVSHFQGIELLQLLNNRCTWRHNDPIFAHMYDPAICKIKKHSSTTAIKKTMLNFLTVIEEERSRMS